jgi:hypothetical protein
MTTDEQDLSPHALLRVWITTDGDPSVLNRLRYFQNLNVSPCQVNAEFDVGSRMHVSVDFSGLPGKCVSLITAKIAESPLRAQRVLAPSGVANGVRAPSGCSHRCGRARRATWIGSNVG